jgi:hypothetical protein
LIDAGGRLSRAAVFAGAAACYTNPAPAQHVTTPPPPPPPGEGADAAVVQDQHFAQPPDGATTNAAAAGSIDGVVVELTSGQPIASTTVALQDQDGNSKQVQTDAKGHFIFNALAAGNYVLSTNQPGGNPRVSPTRQAVTIAGPGTINVTLNVQTAPPNLDRGPCCKPYGAPPARRRVV